MARDYMNLPAMLDALEDEMDQEAAQISDEARKIQARGLQEMERTRTAIKNKSGLIDRMKKFADDMETRNTSNAPPGMGLTTTPATNPNPTSGSGSSPTSAVQAHPAETANLRKVS